MEKEKYNRLKNISIERCGIIKNSTSDPIYRFCLANNIDNLGDFILIYNKQRLDMHKGHNFSYFDGVIDLINLVFFKEELPAAYYLNSMVRLYKTGRQQILFVYVENEGITVGKSNNKTLKRLGFNNNEADKILSQVSHLGKEITIVEAIKSCIDNFDFKNMNSDDEMFITKLHILYQYYDDRKNEIGYDKEIIYKKAEKDLNKLLNLYKKMCILKEEIIMTSTKFEDNISKLSNSDEKAIKLIKKYNEINCK